MASSTLHELAQRLRQTANILDTLGRLPEPTIRMVEFNARATHLWRLPEQVGIATVQRAFDRVYEPESHISEDQRGRIFKHAKIVVIEMDRSALTMLDIIIGIEMLSEYTGEHFGFSMTAAEIHETTYALRNQGR